MTEEEKKALKDGIGLIKDDIKALPGGKWSFIGGIVLAFIVIGISIANFFIGLSLFLALLGTVYAVYKGLYVNPLIASVAAVSVAFMPIIAVLVMVAFLLIELIQWLVLLIL